ncbi:MAG: His/Gly/Thr/Pro-type tRNA ligase C-terminal domain-containing protein, partial [Candidatus Bathyarchaeia archaeon]
LLSRGDPTIIEREMRERGFYEVPGEKPVMLEPRHVEVQAYEEMDSGRHFVPHVVEPSFGIDRIFYAALEYAYTETKGRKVLRLPRDVAPISVSVFPLVSRDGLPEIAKEVYSLLIEEGFTVDYDEAGSIGRRYARADEVGVPIAVTIDYETLEDRTVTLRDINTWKQVRTKISDLPLLLAEYLRGKIEFDQMGTPLK